MEYPVTSQIWYGSFQAVSLNEKNVVAPCVAESLGFFSFYELLFDYALQQLLFATKMKAMIIQMTEFSFLKCLMVPIVLHFAFFK